MELPVSWEDQGRQYHMWFGHGTAPERLGGSDTDGSASVGLGQRLLVLANGAIAVLSPSLRKRAEAQYHAGTLAHLTAAMTAWVRGNRLDQASFADRFFGRAADDPVVQKLRDATLGAASATSHMGMREAAEKLADAMKATGLDRWPRFVADAQARADDATAIRHDDVAPVPFMDDKGQAVTDFKGQPMMRPAGMDPHFFVNQALNDLKVEAGNLVSLPTEDGSWPKKDGLAALVYQAAALSHFRRGGPWDAQRIGGSFHPEFIDYATVAIGLYCAANGITKEHSLMIQNIVARDSHYKSDKEMDKIYSYLLTRNVHNTEIGYSLYQSGRIAATSQH